ncbi:hypothetical protein [Tropicimonas sp. S265A]|uniref:hypothetical protein n=1 Tax=Tropicimonas sp. S265A TaxID=3415134 RepID=UPI003C79A7AB
MSTAFPGETTEDVLASIRRIVAEENGVDEASTARVTGAQSAERPPVYSAHQAQARAARERRTAALLEACERFEKQMKERADAAAAEAAKPKLLTAPIAAAEPRAVASANAGSGATLCKLLLTEDFRVRAPDPGRVAHPAAPAARQGYSEDSDLSEADAKPTLEKVVRDAVADSVRNALHGAVGAEDEADILDDDGYIDAETLRALVIGIVHEELRGELGSQISSRVRKLVRQEINRALQVEQMGYR